MYFQYLGPFSKLLYNIDFDAIVWHLKLFFKTIYMENVKFGLLCNIHILCKVD